MDKFSIMSDKHVVLGLFDPGWPLSPILHQLRHQGIPDAFIDVLSPLPLASPLLKKPVRFPLYYITIVGGGAGLGLGIFLAAGTALLYPIMTGGKPIVSMPVVGIISFETMMLSAIVSTFVAMMVKIAFLQQSGLQHDPRIDEGVVGLSIQVGNDADKAQGIRRLLEEAGASNVEIRTVQEI